MQIDEEAAGFFLLALGGVLFVVLAVVLAIYFIVSFLLYMCFKRIPPDHQKMAPWQAFLLMIPCFSLIWNFFVFPKLAKSFQSYFNSVGRSDVGDCGAQLGMIFACTCVASLIPFVNYLAGPASLIILIVFLVKAFSLRGLIPKQNG